MRIGDQRPNPRLQRTPAVSRKTLGFPEQPHHGGILSVVLGSGTRMPIKCSQDTRGRISA
jgi:hypothetical protein